MHRDFLQAGIGTLDRICQLPLVAGCWILESLKSMSLEKLVYLVFMQQGMQLHTYTNLLLLLLQVLYPQLQKTGN